MVPLLASASHEPSLGDHAILRVVLDPAAVRGPEDTGTMKVRREERLWILNNSVLDGADFGDLLKRLWQSLQEEQAGYDDIVNWWEDMARPAVREFCQSFSKQKARARQGRKDWLYLLLGDALEECDWPRVAEWREELRTLLIFEEQGLKIRSRCKQEVEEERASLYHVGKELGSDGRSCLTKLKVEETDGEGQVREVITDDEAKIEEALVNFHEALFNGRLDSTLKDTGVQKVPQMHLHHTEFLQGLDKLSQQTRKKLEERLTYDEVKINLMEMECGRSPGEDGLTREFYSTCWELIGADMVRVIQGTLDRELLPFSNTKGLTRTCSKVLPPAVPRVTELRPITRLNVDYKLLSKCLASRTRLALPEVVRSRQMVVPGLNIMEGVHNILSAIQYIEKKHHETGEFGGLVASYDEVKAYDVSRSAYVDLVLDKMNFGEKFRRWVLMLTHSATTRILLPRGRLSRPIHLSISLRQGDPFSLIAFEIQFEPYLRRLDQVLVGVMIGGPRLGAALHPRLQATYTEKGPAVVDDVVVTSTDIMDLQRVDQVSAIGHDAQSN